MKKFYRLIFGSFFFSLLACNAFFEEDLSNENLSVIAPADEVQTEICSQIFLWEPHESNAKYRLQIFFPSCVKPEKVVADTLLSKNQFELTLQPGQYEWRIRLENSSSSSNYQYYSLEIIDSDDLTHQVVFQRNPSNEKVLSDKSVFFKWNPLQAAKIYHLTLQKEGEMDDYWNYETQKDTTYHFVEEGAYYWYIQALNEKTSSPVQEVRFLVDLTPPKKPELLKPEDNHASSQNPITFQWNSSDNLSFLRDSIFLYSDSQTSQLVLKKASTSRKIEIEFDQNGTFYWRVKSYDKAGHMSQWSNINTLTITN